jgi:aryl-alcohol dehydrogenase-like predicted oxidoreductase
VSEKSRQHPNLIALGGTELRISPMGIGAWAWGDRFFWGYGRSYTEKDVNAAFQECVDRGVNFFDTAETYGFGRSETLMGKLIQKTEKPVIVTTKFFPYPWRLTRGSLLHALRKSLGRLGINSVDLYLHHWPFPPVSIETWASALADAVDAGLATTVGVSNFNVEQLERAHSILADRGIPLACNQIYFSLLCPKAERDRLLDACTKRNVTLVAYSPLAQGVLTGKYTSDNPLPLPRIRRFDRKRMKQIQDLLGLMREIGQDHNQATPAQVAINWVICQGAVPIPGVKNARQARENTAAMTWRLSENEIHALEEASQNFLES